MVEQQTLPTFYQEDLGYTSNNATRNGKHYQATFSCNSAKLNGNGTVKGVMTSVKSFSGTTYFKGVAQGLPVDEKADVKGRWVSASCGQVKPL